MSEMFEFGTRGSMPQGDKLEHYRVEIRKLKELNMKLEKSYVAKIQALEKQVEQLRSKGGASQGVYQSSSNINQ